MLSWEAWFLLAVVFIFVEITVPTVFCLWLAITSLVLAAYVYFFSAEIWTQLWIFLGVSSVLITAGYRFTKNLYTVRVSHKLNQKSHQLIGQTVVVTTAILHGTGKGKLLDSYWTLEGPDMAVGEQARVKHVRDLTLVVEPIVE